MDLEFDKYCVLDGTPSPTTVLPAVPPRRRAKLEKRISRGKYKSGDLCLSGLIIDDIDADSLSRRRSNMCSPETSSRAKIEFSRDSVAATSSGIMDALCCSSDDDGGGEEEENRCSSSSSGFCARRSSQILHPDLFNFPIDDIISSPKTAAAAKSGPIKRMFGKKIKSPRSSPLGNPVESVPGGTPRPSAICLRQGGGAVLRLERKHLGGPALFEFSPAGDDVVFVAEETRNAKNTTAFEFRSLHKSNTKRDAVENLYGSKEWLPPPPPSNLIGQMQMSCYDSRVMEFVMYDTAAHHVARRPEHETAAMVIEIPEGEGDKLRPVKMSVVMPSGRHGLPAAQSPGPSPLLERWRSGGGCDCGGWDVACQLSVLENSSVHVISNGNQMPFQLFIKGKKEEPVALTMIPIEDGQQYGVNFDHELSTLQAFSICVALLHAKEASVAVERNREARALQRRIFGKDDFGSLIRQQQEKMSGNKMIDQTFPYFVLNPLFSPIARI
ncbi:unnamed protein product [Cuscuta campestris]|uniref:Uncharacterized protein n=1 Tax=Cuscuta campestris TaxID=132261 RepID=A0A484M541_9ASTE|nr:unnamed protein product [Cuscuta campestris]VFQ83964.1 unnamed protein product [Cuscuta campestris]